MGLLDLLLPVVCAGCGDAHGPACPRCLASLAGPPRPAWPTPTPYGLPPPWASAAYDGAVRDLLLGYKERGVGALAGPLAAAVARGVVAALGPHTGRPVVLVPIPSSAAAVRERGRDVVLALARRAAWTLRRDGVPVVVTPALRHGRRVADSAGLDAAGRAANLAGAFVLRRRAMPSCGAAVVVDDLITTGATIAEAAGVLRAAGVPVVAAVAVAATKRRMPVTVTSSSAR